MINYGSLQSGEEKIAVVGMGYVGMPMAIEFSKHFNVIGYDNNKQKIQHYLDGNDPTNEVGDEEIRNCKVQFTSDESELSKAKFFIVAVPTPINIDKTPDLEPVEVASSVVAKYLTKGSVVVYESTVYPGVTEDICVPILEKISGLTCKSDFTVGYSPERINPGDKVHKFTNIKKIVSGINTDTLDLISKVYETVITAGVHRAGSIKVAEAAKVVENSQRDINIAFMNELAMVFDKMDINTNEVIEAMNTKWNALGFRPGLVGGHCIGVDPYYFIYQAEKLGYHSQVILAGRKINDGMGAFVGEAVIRNLIKEDTVVRKAKVAVLGVTFKEDCPDVRNTKVLDIINYLKEYDVTPIVCDPMAEPDEVKKFYGIELQKLEEQKDLDCIIFAVAHKEYKELAKQDLQKYFALNHKPVIIDVKGLLYDRRDELNNSCRYWSL